MAAKCTLCLLLVVVLKMNFSSETSDDKLSQMEKVCMNEENSRGNNCFTEKEGKTGKDVNIVTSENELEKKNREVKHTCQKDSKIFNENDGFHQNNDEKLFCFKQRYYYSQSILYLGNELNIEGKENECVRPIIYEEKHDCDKLTKSEAHCKKHDFQSNILSDKELNVENTECVENKKEKYVKLSGDIKQNNQDSKIINYIDNHVTITKMTEEDNVLLQDNHQSDLKETSKAANKSMNYWPEEKMNLQDKVTQDPPPPGHMKKLGEHKPADTNGGVEVLEYIPNGKDFYTHFIRKRRPLFMKGGAKNWPAVKNWNNETYLKEKYGGVIFDVEYRKIQSAAEYPIKKTMNMTEFLSLYKNIPMYLDSPFPQSNLTNDIFVPYCLQCEEIFSTISSVHLLFSSGGTSSAFHQDGYDNLLTVISGRKEVLVMENIYSEELYADHFETVPGLSPVNPEAVDLVKFPRVADVPFHKIVLYPGDILFIPMHWWHHVRSYESPNIGITLWFFQFPGMESVVEQDEYISYKSVVEEGKRFDRVVKMYPESIECLNQNPPLSNFLNPMKSQ